MNSPERVAVLAPDCLSPIFTEIVRSLRQVGQRLGQTNTSTNVTAGDADRAALITSMVVTLGQVEAAFMLTGTDSLAAVTALCQRLMVRLSEDASLFSAGLAITLEQALSTLLEATDRLLLHEPVPVAWLLPCWASLAAWDLTGQAHPSAMLSLRGDYTKLASIAAPEDASLNLDPRGEFERALLRYLRSESPEEVLQAVQRMTLVIAAIAAREQPAVDIAGWRVLHAVAGLIAVGGVREPALSKKILAAAGRVIRHLGPTGSLPVPAALVREALFAIATASVHTTESAAVVRTFELASQLTSGDASGRATDHHAGAVRVDGNTDVTAGVADEILVSDNPLTNLLVVKALNDEIKTLIASLDVLGRSDLPTPPQLEVLIAVGRALPAFGRIAVALSDLQARLSSSAVHPSQSLAVAACLLSLQQWTERWNAATSRRVAQDIATALDAIGERKDFPEWRTLHRMGIGLQMPSVLAALTQAMTESLTTAERQTEHLINEIHAASEYQSALALIDIRLSEIQAALQLLGDSAILAHLEEVREQLRNLFFNNAADPDLLARERFAQQFVHLFTLIAAIHRTYATKVGESDRVNHPDHDPALLIDQSNHPNQSLPDSTQGLRAIFVEEAGSRIRQLTEWLHAAESVDAEAFAMAANATHALAGCSATVGLSEMRQLAMAMEAVLSSFQRGAGRQEAAALPLLQEALQTLEQILADWSSGAPPQLPPVLLERLLALSLGLPECTVGTDIDADTEVDIDAVTEARQAQQTDETCLLLPQTHGARELNGVGGDPLPCKTRAEEAAAEPRADAVHDELHEVFLEEAADLMPQLDQLLRIWMAEPSDKEAPVQMLRILHTLKGSARMAGEMTLGDELHRMEQTIDELSRQPTPDIAALRSLEATLDQCLQPFVPATPPVLSFIDDLRCSDLRPSLDSTDAGTTGDKVNETMRPPAAENFVTAQPRGKTPVSLQLRVRADFLDRITRSGAELLVGSSRLTNELQLQRQSVADLSDNLGRLRSQLRELEIHAESNIASGAIQNMAAGFDPLEFDRYTRLHELTRMMSESIADLSSLQRSLSRQLDNASLTVTAQGRHARGLQSDLRRVRTLPFASLSGRLQHLLRQIAREKACDVVLDIGGGSVEVDRSVLDRITGALEHLLRNAVAHGIESPAERLSLGKAASGQISMTLSQQGNGLLLQIKDDGRGLDYQRIRQRAVTLGLLEPDAHPDHAVLAQLIFEPGFSTASEITELSGRGIGMDAVRAAVIALGGQIKITSTPGEGTCFMLSLPLTLATMQVVLVTAGSRDVAIPATLVQQVLQLSPSELLHARQTGGLAWQGRQLPLHRLAGLLGEAMADAEIAHRTPVAVLRQFDHELAIELDAIAGHREVVMKNLGPQLTQVPGLAGATVLGDGSIMLIINPLPLPEFVATHPVHSPLSFSTEVRSKQAPRILVVDDSLTVRRASQRLLERHGYTVALARDGLDALAQLRLHLPAAVLLDIEMPRMDGFELLSALRDDPRWRDLPVAMITSRTAERHREHAMKLGATAYLGKPFVEEELLDLLTQWLVSAATKDKLDCA